MRISHETRVVNINDTNGYGYATTRMIDSLEQLGHQISQNDPEAEVGIWFDQPHHWKWRDNQYKIGYHPWESTKLKDDWVERMNKCDEIWTPSPVIAEWYREDGINVPIYVYEHGVDKIWTPKERPVDDGIIKFLHVGMEGARKGGHRLMQAFRTAFADRKDVSLTMKTINPGWNIPKIGKISILNEKMGINDLVSLFHNHHVYVYPSYGEGFGLTPLQAMATGMPTICTEAWAPYKRHFNKDLALGSTLKTSPWANTIHPGQMFRPDFDQLVDILRYSADNYEKLQKDAMSRVPAITAEYDWKTLTQQAFSDLEKRL